MDHKHFSFTGLIRRPHYAALFIITFLIFMVIGLGSSPQAHACTAFLCGYNTSNYSTGANGDTPIIDPTSGVNNPGAAGTLSQPYKVNQGTTLNIQIGYSSAESSGNQNVFTWTQIPDSSGLLADSGIVPSGGTAAELGYCYELVYNTGPYSDPNWETDGQGSISCGSPTPILCETYFPPGETCPSSGNTFPAPPGVVSPYSGHSVVWYQPGSQSAGTHDYNLSITAQRQGTFCMRTHVSLSNNSWPNPSGSNDYTAAQSLASNDLANVVGIKGPGNSSGDMCFDVVPPPATPPQPSCTEVAIPSPGANEQTLVRVEDSNNNVLVPSGDSNPSTASPTTSNYDGDGTEPSWVGTPFFIVGTNQGGTWLYTVLGQNVRVIIINRTDNAGVWTTTYYSDQTINCYNASLNPNPGSGCQLSVEGNVPNGPSNAVEAGSTFTVNATVTNTGSGDLPASINGDPLQVDPGSYNYPASGSTASNPSFSYVSTGEIPYGQSVTVPLTLTAPSGVASDTVYAHPAYSNLFAFGPGSDCSMTVNIYQPFTLTPSAAVTFVGDPENPTGVNYTTEVQNNSGSPPVQASDSSELFFTPSQTNSQIVEASSSDTYDYGSKVELVGTYNIPLARPGVSQVTAGDSYCAQINMSYTTGWVGPGGPTDLADTSGGGPYPSPPSCVVVVNKPFFKVYGSGVSAGGSFPGASPAGFISDWNNNSGLYPSVPDYDYGGGSELGNRAVGLITGYASAQQNSQDLRPPADLSISNTSNISNGTYTPSLGGTYNSSLEPLQQESCSTTSSQSWNGVTPLVNGSYTYTDNVSGPPLVLNASNLPPVNPGDDITLCVTGNVYIDTDILLNGANNGSWNIGNVPSFILDATGNVYIDPSVGELDGLYIAQPGGGANGTIYTCGQDNAGTFSPMSGSLLYTGCNQQLTVYGSFEAQSVNLMRTYGSLRDETPIPSTRTTTYTYSPGPQIGLTWTSSGGSIGIPGMKCTQTYEPDTSWQDNYLCVPPSSTFSLCWESGTPYGCTQCNFKQIDPSSSPDYPYLPGSWHNVAICPNNYGISFSFGYQSCFNNTAVTVNSCHQDYMNGQWYADIYQTSTQYCTQMYEDSDPEGPPGPDYPGGPWGLAYYGLAWETTYICEPLAPQIPTPHTVTTATQPPNPLSCSNSILSNGTSGRTSPRPTCAAEVFDFSPEFYLSAPSTTQGSNSANNAIEIYKLPPVL